MISKVGWSEPRRSSTYGLRHLQAAELDLPLVERGRTDPVPPTDICRRHPGLLLLQYRDDLLFAEPAASHYVRLPSWAGLYLNLEENAGLRPTAAAEFVMTAWTETEPVLRSRPPVSGATRISCRSRNLRDLRLCNALIICPIVFLPYNDLPQNERYMVLKFDSRKIAANTIDCTVRFPEFSFVVI